MFRCESRQFLERSVLPQTSPKSHDQRIHDMLAAAHQTAAEGMKWRDLSGPWHPQPPYLTPEERGRYSDTQIFMKYFFVNFAAFQHWNRYLVATILLHEAALQLLSFASNPGRPDLTVSGAKPTPGPEDQWTKLTEHHKSSLQNRLTEFIGTVSHAFGDFDHRGCLRGEFSRSARTDVGGDAQYEINISAVWQVYPPLLYFSRRAFGAFAAPWQSKGIEQALKRMKWEFVQP